MANRLDRRDLFRKRPEAGNPLTLNEVAEGMASTIDRMAEVSIGEIERLIDELHGIRNLLRSETGRVEREVAGYLAEAQGATTSTKAMANGLTHWKQGGSAID